MLNLALISLNTCLKFEKSPNISHFSFRPQGVALLVMRPSNFDVTLNAISDQIIMPLPCV